MKTSLIEFFAAHRVAANLLMALMILSGLWALTQMSTQFLPTFNLHFITVSIDWSGANAADIENAITIPVEEQLHDLDGLKKMTSRSLVGTSSLTLEFTSGTNMSEALEDVQQHIRLVRNMPKDAKPAQVKRVLNYEEVARLIIVGGHNLDELRPLVERYQDELLQRGIAKISETGLPDREIAIEIPSQTLSDLKLSLNQIADLVARHSQDVPAGSIGKSEVAQELRAKNKKRSISGFNQLPLIHDNQGHLLRLGDIATITKRVKSGQTYVTYQGKPAVELTLFRTEHSKALQAANILEDWLTLTKAKVPQGVSIIPYFQKWKLIKDRIHLLLRNALWGLCIILALLFLFLNFRIALWVALGIPASFLAAIAVLYLYGGSINMVSLFAMIMTLGIIVDDSIVVGEETLSRLQHGLALPDAVRAGAHTMLPPIMASSMTTIVAFVPLMLVGGIIGQILFDIPLVAICVIVASLIECFLVLPGHLFQSLNNKTFKQPIMQPYLTQFREKIFRPIVENAIKHSGITISTSIAIIIITLGIIIGGHTKFTFFPSPEGETIQLNAEFTAGTPPKKVKTFIAELERSLAVTDKQLSKTDKKLLVAYAVYQNRSTKSTEGISKKGEQYASMSLELTSPDKRKTTNQQFIDQWRKNITIPPGIENLTINATRSGPPGDDIDIEISGENINHVKMASKQLAQILAGIKGVENIKDNLPYGKNHIVFTLNPQAHALNLTTNDIGEQLRAAFSGKLAQVFHEPNEEIEVRVMLPGYERHRTSTLDTIPIISAKGHAVPLNHIVTLSNEQGFDVLTHVNGKLTNRITADVNIELNNMNRIIRSLNKNVIPQLKAQYGVSIAYGGRKASQTETLHDMLYGVLLAFALIYIILAWVFSSYGWPFLIITAIPLGLVGAIWGHIILGMPLTILSLFGFFGLSGIVINDSIILINRYKKLRLQDMPHSKAITEASCQRLRPVLLTSFTTIAGLLPLLFERSLQAQFLIPMAVSLVFGLLFATGLILILLPTLLHLYQRKIKGIKS